MKPLQIGGMMVVVAIVLVLIPARPALAATTSLRPTSYTTTSGSSGGQPVSALAVQDQSGTQDDWEKYVEFLTPGVSYTGARMYSVPAAIPLDSLSAIQVRANYRGPLKSTQRWIWSVYDWKAGAYVTIGDNSAAAGWEWTLLTFIVPGTPADYVHRDTHRIKVRLQSGSAVDDADLDYEAVRLSWSDAPPAGNYYVATTGSNSNPGTLTAPWRTVQFAANVVPPGSNVYVRGGIYNEAVTIKVSGTAAGGYITFQNYPGEVPILDGTGLVVPDADTGMILIANRSYLRISGFEMRNYTTATRYRTPSGIQVQGAGHHLELRDNRVHHIRTNYNGAVGGDAHGISVSGTSATRSLRHLIIDGNELFALRLGSSEALVLNGNVEQFEVTNNRVHDTNNIGIDLAGFYGVSPDPATDQARNGVVRGNVVYNITSYNNPAYGPHYAANGIYVDGGRDIRIERNTVYATDIGVEVASESAGRLTSGVTVRNNMIYRNRVVGISLGGYDTQRGGTANCVIVNNTLYANDTLKTGTGEINLQYDTRNNIIKNNIFVSNNQGILIGNDYTRNSGNVVNSNLYYVAGGGSGTWVWKTMPYDGFAAYRAATGNDGASRFVVPRFVDAAAANFHLQTTSPAINAGENLAAAGSLDFDGQARIQSGRIDIGADEKR